MCPSARRASPRRARSCPGFLKGPPGSRREQDSAGWDGGRPASPCPPPGPPATGAGGESKQSNPVVGPKCGAERPGGQGKKGNRTDRTLPFQESLLSHYLLEGPSVQPRRSRRSAEGAAHAPPRALAGSGCERRPPRAGARGQSCSPWPAEDGGWDTGLRQMVLGAPASSEAGVPRLRGREGLVREQFAAVTAGPARWGRRSCWLSEALGRRAAARTPVHCKAPDDGHPSGPLGPFPRARHRTPEGRRRGLEADRPRPGPSGAPRSWREGITDAALAGTKGWALSPWRCRVWASRCHRRPLLGLRGSSPPPALPGPVAQLCCCPHPDGASPVATSSIFSPLKTSLRFPTGTGNSHARARPLWGGSGGSHPALSAVPQVWGKAEPPGSPAAARPGWGGGMEDPGPEARACALLRARRSPGRGCAGVSAPTLGARPGGGCRGPDPVGLMLGVRGNGRRLSLLETGAPPSGHPRGWSLDGAAAVGGRTVLAQLCLRARVGRARAGPGRDRLPAPRFPHRRRAGWHQTAKHLREGVTGDRPRRSWWRAEGRPAGPWGTEERSRSGRAATPGVWAPGPAWQEQRWTGRLCAWRQAGPNGATLRPRQATPAHGAPCWRCSRPLCSRGHGPLAPGLAGHRPLGLFQDRALAEPDCSWANGPLRGLEEMGRQDPRPPHPRAPPGGAAPAPAPSRAGPPGTGPGSRSLGHRVEGVLVTEGPRCAPEHGPLTLLGSTPPPVAPTHRPVGSFQNLNRAVSFGSCPCPCASAGTLPAQPAHVGRGPSLPGTRHAGSRVPSGVPPQGSRATESCLLAPLPASPPPRASGPHSCTQCLLVPTGCRPGSPHTPWGPRRRWRRRSGSSGCRSGALWVQHSPPEACSVATSVPLPAPVSGG